MTWLRICAAVVAAGLLACASVDPMDLKRADLHRRIGQSHLKRGSLELAIREYRKAVELSRKDPEMHFGLAEAYRRKGVLDEAEQSLRTALKLEPDHHDARLNLTVVYLQQERWSDAIRETDALVADPTFLRPSRALVNRGWAHYKSGELEMAERDLREAMATDPENFRVHLNLGLVLSERSEVLEAMVQFEQALKILKRRPPAIFGVAEAQARFHLAQAHVSLGQREKAIRELRQAAKRGGASEWGRKSKEYLAILE